MADFEAAGGLGALLNELTSKLDLTGMTVTGKTPGEKHSGLWPTAELTSFVFGPAPDSDLWPLFCKGNLVPCGRIYSSPVPAKPTVPGHPLWPHDRQSLLLCGTAIEACRFSSYQASRLVRVSVASPPPLKAATKDDVATVTDGRLSGAASGACWLRLPEAALRGAAVRAVRDGDWILRH